MPPKTFHQRLETPEGVVLRWQFKRNCSLTPGQFFGACFVIVALHAIVGTVFWVLGYPVISCFAALESAVFLGCLIAYVRHACDRETITLGKDGLAIEVHQGSKVQCAVLHPAWVRIEPSIKPNGLVSLTERGVRVQLGRHVQPGLRDAMVAELRHVLQASRCDLL